MAWRIVIAGGGFGGLYAARKLERVLPPQAARITLVNDDEALMKGIHVMELKTQRIIDPSNIIKRRVASR